MTNNIAPKKGYGVPSFRTHKKAINIFLFAVVIIAILSVVNYYNLRRSTEIDSGFELSGQRIACCVGWESDYLLTPRTDITLLRYDNNSDCFLALAYGLVDAVALDEITLQSILVKTSGLEVIPNPITTVGCTFYTSLDAGNKLNEFNEFAAAFLQSEEYKAYHDNVFSENYHMAEIEEVVGGKPLIVGYVPDSYPESYIDFTTGKPAGYGIELIQRFALAYGYTIQWVETSDTAALIQLSMNQIDFAACYVSDVYREDTEAGGNAHMTNSYFNADVYLVKVKSGEKFIITGELDSDE